MKKLNTKTIFLLCALIMGSTCVWAQTTYSLQKVTSVESGALYVFEQDGYVMGNTITNSALQTTNSYKTTGLTGEESYVWQLNKAPKGFYMKNTDKTRYLNASNTTSVSLDNSYSTNWGFTFENGVAFIQESKNSRFLGFVSSVNYSYKVYDNDESDLSDHPHAITVYKLVEGEILPSSAASFSDLTPSIDLATTTQFTQTASTAAGYNGTVTYAITDNTAGASIDATTGTVNVTHEGSVTVTATAAAVEGQFQESSASYTLTVTDSRASAPISFPVTTAEAIMGEAFTAPVLTNSESLTVSYYSSNESVATVNETTGAVTLVAPGTTNIIAIFAGNATYKYTTAQYTLTVNKGAQSLPYTESFNQTIGEFTSDGAKATGDIDVWNCVISADYTRATSSIGSSFYAAESWLTSPVINAKNEDHIALTFEQSIDSYFGTIADEAVVYAKRVGDADWTKLTITYPATPKNGYSDFQTTTVDLSAFAGNNIQIAFYYKGTTQKAGTWRIKNVKVAVSAEDVTVTGYDLRTFVSDNALDFTDVDNLEAYIAKEEDGNVKLYQVRKVPAATGVLLRAKNAATNFVVPFATTAAEDVSGNIFLRGTGSAVENGTGPYNWILSTKDGVLGFYPASGRTVAADHAYLQTTVPSARIDLTFGDDATAITNVSSPSAQPAATVYDLQGRRVAQPARGLYIVNGRKVSVK